MRQVENALREDGSADSGAILIDRQAFQLAKPSSYEASIKGSEDVADEGRSRVSDSSLEAVLDKYFVGSVGALALEDGDTLDRERLKGMVEEMGRMALSTEEVLRLPEGMREEILKAVESRRDEKINALKQRADESRQRYVNVSHETRSNFERLKQVFGLAAMETRTPDTEASLDSYRSALEEYQKAEIERVLKSHSDDDTKRERLGALHETLHIQERARLSMARYDAETGSKANVVEDAMKGTLQGVRRIGEAWKKVPAKYKIAASVGLAVAGGALGASAAGAVVAGGLAMRMAGMAGLGVTGFEWMDRRMQSRRQTEVDSIRASEQASFDRYLESLDEASAERMADALHKKLEAGRNEADARIREALARNDADTARSLGVGAAAVAAAFGLGAGARALTHWAAGTEWMKEHIAGASGVLSGIRERAGQAIGGFMAAEAAPQAQAFAPGTRVGMPEPGITNVAVNHVSVEAGSGKGIIQAVAARLEADGMDHKSASKAAAARLAEFARQHGETLSDYDRIRSADISLDGRGNIVGVKADHLSPRHAAVHHQPQEQPSMTAGHHGGGTGHDLASTDTAVRHPGTESPGPADGKPLPSAHSANPEAVRPDAGLAEHKNPLPSDASEQADDLRRMSQLQSRIDDPRSYENRLIERFQSHHSEVSHAAMYADLKGNDIKVNVMDGQGHKQVLTIREIEDAESRFLTTNPAAPSVESPLGAGRPAPEHLSSRDTESLPEGLRLVSELQSRIDDPHSSENRLVERFRAHHPEISRSAMYVDTDSASIKVNIFDSSGHRRVMDLREIADMESRRSDGHFSVPAQAEVHEGVAPGSSTVPSQGNGTYERYPLERPSLKSVEAESVDFIDDYLKVSNQLDVYSWDFLTEDGLTTVFGTDFFLHCNRFYEAVKGTGLNEDDLEAIKRASRTARDFMHNALKEVERRYGVDGLEKVRDGIRLRHKSDRFDGKGPFNASG
jgi:hypothetical protein